MSSRILLVLSEDPDGLSEELAQWSIDHVAEMLELPGILSAQAFRLDPEFEKLAEGRPETPRYRNLCVYEIEEGYAGVGSPQADSSDQSTPPPTPPGGIGPNRPAGFIFTATTDLLRKN